MMRFSLLVAMIVALLLPPAAWADEPATRALWVYAPCNFQVNERVNDLIALTERAATARYNGIVVADWKFGRIDDRPPHYYANLKRFREAAARLKIEVIPCVMPIGYSGSILSNNPNLAEGIAVRDCEMLVRNGRATVADTTNLLDGGDFERGSDAKPAPGWDWVDGPGTSSFRDTVVRHGGAAATRMQDFRKGNEYGNCRLCRKVTVKPWQQYEVRVWIRSEDVQPAGDVKVAVLADKNRSLNFTNLKVKPTQDWTEHVIVFNSMEHAEVRVYVGIWGGREGRLWIDDVSLRQVAGVNMLRREGCPLRVTSADGRTEYVEGRDFEPWSYPKMGSDAYPGSFKVTHPQPPLVLAPGSRIAEGDRLRVSFYHTVIIYDDQVCCCLSHDELFKYLARQCELIRKHLGPKRYFMSHDEIRVAGQCELCRAGNRTAGQVLAENVRRCVEVIRKVEPEAEVLVWSDMFDPHHNARDGYYLAGSTLAESWEGLDPSVTVVNWNGGRCDESLKFFADRGHRQVIAGYYDDGDHLERNLRNWLDAAAKAKGAQGIIYTTWRNDYSNLERFARALDANR